MNLALAALTTGVNPHDYYHVDAVHEVAKDPSNPRRQEAVEFMAQVLAAAIHQRWYEGTHTGRVSANGVRPVLCANCNHSSLEHDVYGKCLFDSTHFKNPFVKDATR